MTNRHPAGANRIALTVIGLLLTAIGVAAFIRGLNVYPRSLGAPHAAVVDQSARAFAHGNTWFWVAMAIAMFVMATAALYWIAQQLRRDSAQVIRCGPRSQEGATTVSARALAGALRDDLGDSPAVRGVRARFIGHSGALRLHLSVTVDPDADPAAAKDQIRQALQRLHRAVEIERLPTVVDIRTGR